MEALHENGIAMAQVLQERLFRLEKFWLWATYLGDPKSVFIVFFPIAYFLDRKVGVEVLWIALISEWLNLVFKWFLFGERPYWWVRENDTLTTYGFTLRQFPSTCESGPGSPSGHCMITGAALWPLLIASVKYVSQLSQSRLVRFLPYAVYCSLMLAVGVSRIYILAHFPHQVLAGIVTGGVLGHLLRKSVPDEKEFRFYVITSLALLLGAALLYWSMIGVGIDPSWSIQLASKWCSDPKWVRLDTRPFASVTRSAGNALGLGLTVHSPIYSNINQQTFNGRERLCGVVLALGILHALDTIPLPTDLSLLFYSLNFLRNAIFPLVLMTVVPGLVKSINRREITPKIE